MPTVRRLTAILAADVAGYSRLMGVDEEGTHERLKAHLRELIEPKIAEHRGRVVKNTGDGFLAEFASVVDTLRCVVEMQRGMVDRNAGTPPEERIEFRIGINLGDVIAEEHDIFGEGVNVAARLEALAEPGGVLVSHTVHDQVRDRLPFVFEDLGEHQVKNIARPVRVYRVHEATAGKSPTTPPQPVLPLPDKPSIAVLPFQNMSGDPEQEYFADGMVEEIITALSRIRWLFVIARNSSFIYKGQAADVKRVGRELGVRYVLEGSVRKAGNRVRITAQLIDAISGAHVWADRFDGSLEDVFELQDKVAISVAGVIEPTLEVTEVLRSGERPTHDLTGYDLYLRALPSIFRMGDKKGCLQTLDLLEQALQRDPHYGPALSGAAFCHEHVFFNGWSDTPAASRRTALTLAQRAIENAKGDPAVLANAAHVLGVVGEDINAAIALIDRTLSLNPSFARGWYVSATLRLFAGQLDAAIEHAQRSLRLSPRVSVGAPMLTIGCAYFLNRQFEKAAEALFLSVQERPAGSWSHRQLASCYAHMGRLDEARSIITRLHAITADVVPSFIPYRNPEHCELLLSGLRLAAGEAA
jgi:adenylate cyclase